jgi:hypothetical protein
MAYGLGLSNHLCDPLLVHVHIDNVPRDVVVSDLVTLVEDDEKEVKAGHDRRCNVNIVLQCLGSVVATVPRIGGGENRSTRIECGLNTSLSDRDRLLLHGLVDRDLVLHIHLVKFVDTADTVIGKHQCPRLDTKLTRLGILDHRRRQTGSRRRLARGVYSAGHKLGNILEKLGLGGRGIADDADIDVATQVCPRPRRLVHSTGQHQKHALLDFVVAWFRGLEV